MLLAIDSGNTNVVFALFEGERVVTQWRAATDQRRTADEYAVWLLHLMQASGFDPRAVTGAVISNVVPPLQRDLKLLCERYFRCTPVTVEEAVVTWGLDIRLSRPEQVGADRLANAVGAHADHGGSLIVIDFGTATTFDVVDEDGGYAGGVIAPGINLSLEALYAAAARLPRITIEKPARGMGHDTVSAMQSGVFWGYVGLIEGLVERIKRERGGPHKVIGTGGLAPLFSDATAAIEVVDGDLTLRGMRLLYERHRAKNS